MVTKNPAPAGANAVSCYEVYYSTEWLYLTATIVALCALFISPKGKACGLKDEHPASLILKDQRGVILKNKHYRPCPTNILNSQTDSQKTKHPADFSR